MGTGILFVTWIIIYKFGNACIYDENMPYTTTDICNHANYTHNRIITKRKKKRTLITTPIIMWICFSFSLFFFCKLIIGNYLLRLITIFVMAIIICHTWAMVIILIPDIIWGLISSLSFFLCTQSLVKRTLSSLSILKQIYVIYVILYGILLIGDHMCANLITRIVSQK